MAAVPHLSVILNFSKADHRLALLDIKDGKLDNAIKFFSSFEKAKYQIAETSRDLTLIDCLVDATIDNLYWASVRQLLASSNLDASHLDTIIETIRIPDNFTSYQHVMEAERAIMGSWVWNLLDVDKSEISNAFFTLGVLQESDLSFVEYVTISLFYPYLFIDHDQHYFIRNLWTQERLAKQFSKVELSYEEGILELNRLSLQIREPEHRWAGASLRMSNLLIVGNEQAFKKIVNTEVLQRQGVAAVYLKKYEKSYGEHPQNLEAAGISDIWDLHDPITLEPMQYRLEPDGTYTLYSVALNGMDDGGVPVPKVQDGKKIKYDTAPDWVWPKVVSE